MFRRICKPFILLASTLLLVSVVSANAVASSDSTMALLQKAVDGDWRSAAHKARDQYRHPIETLEFFGLKPDMTDVYKRQQATSSIANAATRATFDI